MIYYNLKQLQTIALCVTHNYVYSNQKYNQIL